jgi:hypothetical protein
VICTQLDADNKPVNPGNSFPSATTTKIYCWLSYEGAKPNVSEILCKWYYEGDPLGDPTMVVAKQTSGTAAFHVEITEGTFPAGKYSVELYTDGNLALTLNFTLE